MNKEIRSLQVKELRAVKAEDGTRTISGTVSYNTPSVDLGGFTEVIAPGAFTNSLDGDVLLLRQHEPTLLMGRTKSGTLTLKDSDDGLHFSCVLPNTTTAADLAESIDRGDLDGVSFGFICLEDKWPIDAKGQVVRTILEAELLEISPCSFAAYPDNSVSVRSCPQEVQDKLNQKLEVRDSDDDDAENAIDEGCQCDCPECEDGDCSQCSDDKCDCEGCDCYEMRNVLVQIEIAKAF
jgi:HK97 family phage prohead protease